MHHLPKWKFSGRTANFPATRRILIDVTGLTAAPGSPSDAGLVHSALGGDVASFSALLDRYRASLYARALAYLGRDLARQGTIVTVRVSV